MHWKQGQATIKNWFNLVTLNICISGYSSKDVL